MDTISKQKRSENMAAIKSFNTKPEIAVKSVLRRMKLRYKFNLKKMPGKPDFYLTKNNLVIFVNGCFWHQHKSTKCVYVAKPKSNKLFWKTKLEQNVVRDKKNKAVLKHLGYNVLTLWECEIGKKSNSKESFTKIENKIKKSIKIEKI